MASLPECVLRKTKSSYRPRLSGCRPIAKTPEGARIWIADDASTSKPCLIKADTHAGENQVDLVPETELDDEAELMQMAAHGHVLKCLEFGQGRIVIDCVTSRVAYMVTGHYEGITLKEAIASNPLWSTHRAKQLFQQLVEVVRHLHRSGIVHHALSLENVYVDKNLANLQLCDFSKATSSPIRSQRQELMKACAEDVYSLGIMLFCMMTKHYPFGVDKYGHDNEWKGLFYSPWRLSYWQYVAQNIRPISVDFINLVNALLEADPAKRISTDRILAHPFLSKD